MAFLLAIILAIKIALHNKLNRIIKKRHLGRPICKINTWEDETQKVNKQPTQKNGQLNRYCFCIPNYLGSI